ncbi:hypothetical protein AZI87_16765 [Bdellovibrio bacteriovorus]|uniref:Uncharacterized protein n=1 Tax=Bdellovibrio bacteriovorus TaxID=959 RepID=A0A161PQJ8_BDEBC|nr:hypothetical protein [Bdellovibrio bacteriovorus]KYG62916.1 hypothetical protein AZI87_16765 [Bdellovibrio bacteriovorus]
MTRKNLFYAIIAFVVGVSVWLFYVNREMRETQSLILQQAERPTRTVAAVPETNLAVERARVQSEITVLQQQISDERTKLQNQQRLLEEIRARTQNSMQNQNPNNSSAIPPQGSYGTQLRSTSNQIQDFLEDLQGFDRIQEDINQHASDLMRDQTSQAQMLKEQLDQDIRNMEAAVRETQQEWTFWVYNGNYINEKTARLSELQTLLETQRQQIEVLKQQRADVSAQALANTQAIQSEKQQALQDLQQTRLDIRDEIAALRQEMVQLQQVQSQAQSNQSTLSSQIRQAQENVRRQQEQIRVLESNLQQKNEELSLIR